MPGTTVWLTGLPSAGKTTLAMAAAARLRLEGRRVEVLDGDEVRSVLAPELGFSRGERDANVARIGYVAKLLARNGVLVFAAVVSPFALARKAVRHAHETDGVDFVEVHVATPVSVCVDRDVKRLYARQRAGELSGLTGVDAPYEPPDAPELRLDTTDRPLIDCVNDLCVMLGGRR